jgi:hypothetical protein
VTILRSRLVRKSHVRSRFQSDSHGPRGRLSMVVFPIVICDRKRFQMRRAAVSGLFWRGHVNLDCEIFQSDGISMSSSSRMAWESRCVPSVFVISASVLTCSQMR